MPINWRNLYRLEMIEAPFLRRGIGKRYGWMLFESARLGNIRWLKAGYRFVAGGPIATSGYYIDPATCDPMCCGVDGPFRTKRLALLSLERKYGKAPRFPHPRLRGQSSGGAHYISLPAILQRRRLRLREKQLSTPYISGAPLFGKGDY